jgi:hypothetical protein
MAFLGLFLRITGDSRRNPYQGSQNSLEGPYEGLLGLPGVRCGEARLPRSGGARTRLRVLHADEGRYGR